jgi:hypothetical protein
VPELPRQLHELHEFPEMPNSRNTYILAKFKIISFNLGKYPFEKKSFEDMEKPSDILDQLQLSDHHPWQSQRTAGEETGDLIFNRIVGMVILAIVWVFFR